MDNEDVSMSNKTKQTEATKQQPKQGNLWNDILKESMTKKDLEQSHVFIFGDKLSGKKSLIKSMNKDLLNKTDLDESFKRSLKMEETTSKFAMIDYTYLNIKKLNDADGDIFGKINVWIFNDMLEKGTFEVLFRPENLFKAMCLIVIDLSRPWDILDSLRKWSNFIYDSFANLLLKTPLDKQEELREKIVEYLKLYEDPQLDEEGNIKKEQLSEETLRLKVKRN